MDPENPYIGRVVVLLTPVLAGVAGWVVQFIADNLPGNPALDETEITALMVAGVLAVAGVAYKWLDNRGDYEQAVQLNAIAHVEDHRQHPPDA